MVSLDGCRCCVVFLALICSLAVLAYSLVLRWNPSETSNSNSTGSRAVNSLKLLFIISRHGNRQPYVTLPNDPYPLNDTKDWPYGPAQLTTHGRVQMFYLGEKIRSLYNGFLSPLYYGNDLYASSTTMDRTLLSGEALLAGLYPPTGFQIWNKRILWQPIPLYTNTLDKAAVLSLASCPRFYQIQAVSLEDYEKQNAANLTTVNNYLNQHTGANMTGYFGIFVAWDSLISEDTEGLTLPGWTKQVYPEPLADLMGKLYIANFAGTDIMTRLEIGPLFDEMLEVMKSKVNKTLTPDRQLYYYSGHDTSLVNLQVILGIPKPSIIGVVKPGSAMIYELHQDSLTGQFSVQVLYIDGSSLTLDPIPLNIPGCGTSCDFNQLVNITHKFSNVDFDQECRLNHTKI